MSVGWIILLVWVVLGIVVAVYLAYQLKHAPEAPEWEQEDPYSGGSLFDQTKK